MHAYGVVSADPTPSGFGAGLGGSAVEVIMLNDDLGVLVSRLSGDLANLDAWQEHADDVAWLGDVAQAHHTVLQEAVVRGDVVPLRLPGLHPDESALRHAFQDRIDTVKQAMARVHNRWEWGVKAYHAERASGSDEESVAATSGREYLGRRIAEKRARESSAERIASTVRAVVDRLASTAVEVVENAPQDPALSGRAEPMVLNAAFLVERVRSDDFVDDVGKSSRCCADEGLSLEVNGPWPPYNFTAVGS